MLERYEARHATKGGAADNKGKSQPLFNCVSVAWFRLHAVIRLSVACALSFSQVFAVPEPLPFGKVSPEWYYYGPDGGTVGMSNFHGKVVLLVLARIDSLGYSAPFERELETLWELNTLYRDRGLVIIVALVGQRWSEIDNHLTGMEFTSESVPGLHDTFRFVPAHTSMHYALGVGTSDCKPFNYIFDRERRVRFTRLGEAYISHFQPTIEKYLNQPELFVQRTNEATMRFQWQGCWGGRNCFGAG